MRARGLKREREYVIPPPSSHPTQATRAPIDETAVEKIWNLAQGDPLYIKALFTTRYNDTKDYTNEDNIIAMYTEEITHGEIYKTWIENIAKGFYEMNKKNLKPFATTRTLWNVDPAINKA